MTVVDIGANVGDWSAELLRVVTPYRLVAIEPQPLLQATLRSRLAKYQNTEVFPVAVGADDGTISFNVYQDSHLASVLKPAPEIDGVYGEAMSVIGSTSVPVRRLDGLLPDDEVTLMKIDVQGYEASVLAGAADVLRRTRYIIIEVVFHRHYIGDSDFTVLHQLLMDAGFHLVDMSRPHPSREARAMWADAVYGRS
jgi:FkbM family methyltransferase